MAIAYIALGSNLNEPVAQLEQAIVHIDQLAGTKLLQTSSFYGSKPLGPQDQPDYVNAVVKIETSLKPLDLLDALQQIENQQGRVRLRRWGERTLDLDILLYDDLAMQSERLTIPHYDMHNREFVIVPLAEIAPDLAIPTQKSVAELLPQFQNHQMQIVKP